MKKMTVLVQSALVAGIAASLVGLPAHAQEKVEKIEVTGSNIKRTDTETASPVQIITRKDIERTSAQSVNELLQSITSAGAGLDDRFTNGFAPGAGSLNLRSLGFNSTLILVNGRRLPTFPFAQQVGTSQGFNDLNTIPLGAVDRVEILKDGASAIYGADAVAGVVNIILRRDYQGAEITGGTGISGKSDGATYQAGFTGGLGNLTADKYNLLVGANFNKRKEILSRARDFAGSEDLRPRGGADRRSSYGYPGTYTDTVTQDFAFAPGCGPATQRGGNSERGPFCRFDRAQFGSLLPDSTRLGLFTKGTFELTSNVSAFAEVLFSQAKTKATGFPTPTTDDIAIGSNILPVGNPNNPFPNPTEIRHRFVDVGSRNGETKNDTTRFLLGLKGTGMGWDWETALNFNKIKVKDSTKNEVLATSALCVTDPSKNGTVFDIADPASPTGTSQITLDCSKFAGLGLYDYNNPFANPALTNALRFDNDRKGDSKLNGFDFRASRELMQMGGGAMGLAAGIDHRTEKVSDVPDRDTQIANTLGLSASAAFGDRKVSAVFGELSLPFSKTVEANAAIRYDKYSGNGNYSKASPKLAVRWQPEKSFLVRSSISNSYRAPSLFESTPATQTSFSFGISDPTRCILQTEPDCTLDVRRVQRGNPNLKPEDSRVYNLGFVLEPNNIASFGVDFWRFDRKNEISAFNDQLLVNIFANDPTIVGRDASGRIETIFQQPIQLNKTTTYGTDLEFRTRHSLGDMGKVSTKLLVTYVDKYIFNTIDDAQLPIDINLAGSLSQPRTRGSADIVWSIGPWETTLGTDYVQGSDPPATPAGQTLAAARTGDYFEWNLSAAYTGFKGWNLRGTVSNLFDHKPPFFDQTNGSQAGYDVQLYSPKGRYFTTSVTYKF